MLWRARERGDPLAIGGRIWAIDMGPSVCRFKFWPVSSDCLGQQRLMGWGFGGVVLTLAASSVSQNQVPAQQGQGSEASGHPAKDLVGGVNWGEATSLCTDAPLEVSEGA